MTRNGARTAARAARMAWAVPHGLPRPGGRANHAGTWSSSWCAYTTSARRAKRAPMSAWKSASISRRITKITRSTPARSASWME